MEIIHVVLGKANPERMNGVNKVVNELATQQALAGFKVSVWGISADLNHNYPERNYETKLFLKAKFPFSLCPTMKEAILNKDHGTVFHLHGGFIPQLCGMSGFLYNNNVPFVFTPHGAYNTIAVQKNYLAKTIYRRYFESKILKKANTIHVLGASEIDGIKKWKIKTPVKIIPYGFNLSGQSVRNPNSVKPFIVGFCGRIDIVTKGLDALLAGFKLFQTEHRDSELWIIGGGGELSKLKELVKNLDLSDSVMLHGAKYGIDKEILLEQCNVFAHPSRNEGLPASVLEAASFGIPCLVTKATNTGKSVEKYNAGIVIEETTANLVSEGLSRIYNLLVTEGKSVLLRENARKMIMQGYNWNLLMESYKAMYANILP
jgi:glycosyltransferase involved in cell wall biosynthesis